METEYPRAQEFMTDGGVEKNIHEVMALPRRSEAEDTIEAMTKAA